MQKSMQQEQHQAAAAIPFILAGVEALPQLIKVINAIIDSFRAMGMTDEQIKLRLAGNEVLLDPIAAEWAGYHAKRHPGDTGA